MTRALRFFFVGAISVITARENWRCNTPKSHIRKDLINDNKEVRVSITIELQTWVAVNSVIKITAIK